MNNNTSWIDEAIATSERLLVILDGLIERPDDRPQSQQQNRTEMKFLSADARRQTLKALLEQERFEEAEALRKEMEANGESTDVTVEPEDPNDPDICIEVTSEDLESGRADHLLEQLPEISDKEMIDVCLARIDMIMKHLGLDAEVKTERQDDRHNQQPKSTDR